MKDTLELIGKGFLFILIWAGFVGIITSMDDRTLDNIPVLFKGVIVIFVFISPYFIGKAIWGKAENAVNHVSDNIKSQKEIKVMKEKTIISMEEYADAKNRFKYVSDNHLLEKYSDYQSTKKEDLIRLALEEELVERNLITHSPMHEKIDKIQNKFKSS